MMVRLERESCVKLTRSRLSLCSKLSLLRLGLRVHLLRRLLMLLRAQEPVRRRGRQRDAFQSGQCRVWIDGICICVVRLEEDGEKTSSSYAWDEEWHVECQVERGKRRAEISQVAHARGSKLICVLDV